MFEDIPNLDLLSDLSGRSVLVRADLNAPLHRQDNGAMGIADDFRIQQALPTLRWLVDRGATVTVASHLGRPRGRYHADLGIDPVRRRLNQLVPGVTVMENLRFDPGEEGNDPAFGAKLVRGQQFYVNDAFGACHRAHASIVYPPQVLPSVAGLLLGRELQAMATVLDTPARAFTVVVGGAKVTDKLGTIAALARRADQVLIGGAMALTFLAAQGRKVGASPIDETALDTCASLLDSAAPIVTPDDLVIVPVGDDPTHLSAEHIQAEHIQAEQIQIVSGDVPAGWQALDIGPRSRQHFADAISQSATVLWNGPMGRFEDPRFADGTSAVAHAIAACRGYTVVGGGDTVAAVRALHLAEQIDHLSSGGGAMLELLERGDLPGIAALRSQPFKPAAPRSQPARSSTPPAGSPPPDKAVPTPRPEASAQPVSAATMLGNLELPQPVQVPHAATLAEVATTLTDRHVSAVLVGTHPVWLVTEHDIAGALAAGLDPEASVDHIANRTPRWITTGSTVRDAVDMMVQRHVRELLVISPEGAVVGILPLALAARILLSRS